MGQDAGNTSGNGERATRAFSTLAHGSKFGIPTSAQEALRHKNPSHTACWADSSDFRASSGMKRCKLQVVNSEKQEKQKRAHTSWSQDLTYFHTPKFLDELSEINAYLGKNVIHRADWDSHRLHCLSPAPRARHTIAGNKLTRRELSWASLENTKTQVEGFRALGTDCHPQHQGHENPVNPTVLSREAPDWNSSLPAYSNRAQVHDLNSITSYKGLFFSSLILKCLYLFTQLSMETY